ncbi:MAG: hypothetical protein IPK17_35325 [Chloroflexi bacterium]|nr:hypothetical protein [Chloroflexota bacterium]
MRGRTANEATMGNAFRLRLAKVAIGKLFNGVHNRDAVHIRLATGLPCDHMRDAAELKKALLGTHLVQTDSAEVIANVTEVMVIPQPYGTIYSRTLTPAAISIPRIPSCGQACVMWGRTRLTWRSMTTASTSTRRAGAWRAAYSPRRSGSRNHSNGTIARRCPTRSSRTYSGRAGSAPAAIWSITARRSRKPSHRYGAPRCNLLSESGKRGRPSMVYLSGRRSELVLRDVMSAYPQTQLVKQAQIANAQGYLNYARFAETAR